LGRGRGGEKKDHSGMDWSGLYQKMTGGGPEEDEYGKNASPEGWERRKRGFGKAWGTGRVYSGPLTLGGHVGGNSGDRARKKKTKRLRGAGKIKRTTTTKKSNSGAGERQNSI